MSRSRSGRTARETVIAARVAAASGTATVPVVQGNESRQTVDADWDDFYHFPQVVTGTTPKTSAGFEAWKAQAGASELLATGSHAVAIETLAADSQRPGHWGDKLRVREKMGGTVSTACTYSLHFVGLGLLQRR